MTSLPHYQAFRGRHWDTGTICNLLAYRGVRAPHTGHPFSEALLFGISGGVAISYFVFEYPGYVSQVSLGVRYPFEPIERIWTRLQLHPAIYITGKPDVAAQQLQAVLAAGQPALVWADALSLPYSTTPPLDENFALMLPVLVFGYDPVADVALLADRAQVPLQIRASELAAARARQQQAQHRMVVLEPPATIEAELLVQAALAGMRDCVALYTLPPPRGPADNFGLAALHKWAAMLADQESVQGWLRMFPPGVPLYAALTALYGAIESREQGGAAARLLYADFLEEAAVLLSLPPLRDVARLFRTAANQWRDLAHTALPDSVPALHVARTLLQHRDQLAAEQGMAAIPEIQQINARLAAIQHDMAVDFPLDAAASTALYAALRQQVVQLAATEQAAVQALQELLASRP